MDWRLFAQLAAAFIVAMAGGWLGHYFSARRDLANERRKLRVSYLLEAYRKLEGASERNYKQEHYWADLESATADIQLLGSPNQVAMARQFAQAMGQHNTASTNMLMRDLRQSLRAELKLEPVTERILLLRFTKKN